MLTRMGVRLHLQADPAAIAVVWRSTTGTAPAARIAEGGLAGPGWRVRPFWAMICGEMAATGSQATGAPVTLLFTDVAGSTAILIDLGTSTPICSVITIG